MSFIAIALGFWHYALAIILIAAALALLVYLPGKLGGIAAAVLGSIAAATFSYQFGFQERGKLDQSIQLQAELQERQREAQAAKAIADRAVQRVNEAETKAASLQEQVDDYERKLQANAACIATDADARGLQSIGPDNPPQPPRRPFNLR